MGCKPSKETLQSAPHGGRQSAIKSSPVDVISDHEEKLVSLKGEEETAENDVPLTSQEVEEEEQAAIKIQAAFKGYKVRKTMAAEPSKAELEAEFRADDKELCHAATKIQASFRGHQARAQMTAPNAKVDELSKDMQKLNPAADEPEPEEELDIDLSDPDLHKAATKIQASFRGHKVRKDDK